MKVIACFLIVSLIACSTQHSQAGRFVTDVRIDGDQLVVEHCQMDYMLEDKTGLYVVIAIVLLPLLLAAAMGGGGGGGGGGFGDAKTGTLSRSQCASGRQDLPGVVGGIR